MHKLLKTLSIVALSLLVGVGVSYAATTGKVQGTVRDAQTGEVSAGCQCGDRWHTARCRYRYRWIFSYFARRSRLVFDDGLAGGL